MFKKKDKNGVVGADKNADRQVIVWITDTILRAIQKSMPTKDLGQLTLRGAPGEVQSYSMKNACEVWGNVPLSVICEKFKKAYNSKLFSKSKKYVLPYFEAVRHILSNNNPKLLPDLLNTFAESCKMISESAISNRKALFSAFEIQSTGTSTFKTAMDALIKEYEKIQTQKKLDEDRTKCKRTFELLVQQLLTDLEKNYSWSVFDDLKDRLDKLVKCFETAYLSGGKLTVKHPTYTLEPKTGSYLLTAYPVLHALSEKTNTDKITDNIVNNINTFVEGAYTRLNDESKLMYQPVYGAPKGFETDLNAVVWTLLEKCCS